MKLLLSTAAALALLALPLFLFAATEEAEKYMKAFPDAEKGMTRHVLKLEKMKDESLYKVELIVGQTVHVDEANRYFLGGRIETETIKGWGFTRYVVEKIGPMGGTLIAVDPNAPKVERFVKLGGEPYLIRYNSRLPVVVYVPQEAEVRYRIWRADEEMSVMKQG